MVMPLARKLPILNLFGFLIPSETNGGLFAIWMARKQGNQIWRIFAQWAIVYFGQFFENYST
jgi:hypothetical protein